MSELIEFRDEKRKRSKKNDSVFDQIFVDSLQELKNKNPETFRVTCLEIYKKQIVWEDVVKLEKHELLALYYRFKENIMLQNSIIDLDKLTEIIQICKTGFGGCDNNSFGCSRCHSNCSDLDPDVCAGCAKKMARYIAINYKTIIKENVEKEE